MATKKRRAQEFTQFMLTQGGLNGTKNLSGQSVNFEHTLNFLRVAVCVCSIHLKIAQAEENQVSTLFSWFIGVDWACPIQYI